MGQFTPDEIHNRLKGLWINAKEFDEAKLQIVADPRTADLLLGSNAAHKDGSVRFSHEWCWREIPITSKRVIQNITSVTPIVPPPERQFIEEPFCLSIACEKNNGRIVYFDDPETHESFL